MSGPHSPRSVGVGAWATWRPAVLALSLAASFAATEAAAQSGPAIAKAAKPSASVPRSAVSFTGQPEIVWPQGKGYVVIGYRSAKFGMTETEVREAIAADFGAVPVATGAHRLEETTILSVALDALSPADGPARVSYIFGKTSGRLITVTTVWWTRDDADATAREALTRAAAKATGEFMGYSWKLFTTARGLPAGPNALMVFAAGDEAGGGVEVRLEGVQYTWRAPDGTTGIAPPPDGPTILRIAYAASVGKPDIRRLAPNSF
jgi:hypothetical protein